MHEISRRTMLGALGASVLSTALPLPAAGASANHIQKKIPSSRESIPVIGMGTWQTFNVGEAESLRRERAKILKTFFEFGGGMVDSSPMYGSSHEVVGWGLNQMKYDPGKLFAADKIWTSDGGDTVEQLGEIRAAWDIPKMDLMQVHNLRAWRPHLETLKRLKEEKKIRYIGITTSHGRRHSDVEEVMKKHDIDFVQLTYNMTHRAVEDRLLPLASERGIAVIANRPYDGGELIKGLQRRGAKVPEWAREFDATNWAQFLLKWIVSHPSMTVAIPATTKVEHMKENMSAAYGRLPDQKMRKKMVNYLESL